MSESALLAVNFCCYCMWFAAIHLLLERRYPLLPTILGELVSFFPTYFLSSAFSDSISALRTLSVVGVLLLLTLLLYRGKWYRKLLTVLLVLLMLFFSEFLTASLLPPGQFGAGVQGGPGDFSPGIYALYLFLQAMLLSALVLLGRRIQRRHSGGLASFLPLLFLLFPLSQFLLLLSWFPPIVSNGALPDASYTFLTVFVCLAADIALAAALGSAAQSAELQMQNRLMEQRLHTQAEQGETLLARREQIRALREELVERSETIESLLAQGRGEDAARCADSLRLSAGRGAEQIPGCAHTVIASFLTHRQRELADAGIELELRLSLPESIAISDTDLICALGNLLDNAAEACASCQDKRILLRADCRKPYLRIETDNAALPAPRPGARRSKWLERGIGSAILEDLAQRYDGEFRTKKTEGRYTASLLLKEGQEHAAHRDL